MDTVAVVIYNNRCQCLATSYDCPLEVRLTPQRGEGVATVSRGVPAEAMPSVVKVLAEVPP